VPVWPKDVPGLPIVGLVQPVPVVGPCCPVVEPELLGQFDLNGCVVPVVGAGCAAAVPAASAAATAAQPHQTVNFPNTGCLLAGLRENRQGSTGRCEARAAAGALERSRREVEGE